MPNIKFVRFLTEEPLVFDEPQLSNILKTWDLPGDVVGLAEDYDWESPHSKLPRGVQDQMHWRPLAIEEAIYHVDEHPEGYWSCAQAFFKLEGIEGFHPSSEFCDVRKVFKRAGLLLPLEGDLWFVPIASEVFSAFNGVDRAFDYAEPFDLGHIERKARAVLSGSFLLGDRPDTDRLYFTQLAADVPRWIVGSFTRTENEGTDLVAAELVEEPIPDFQVQNAIEAVRADLAAPRI